MAGKQPRISLPCLALFVALIAGVCDASGRFRAVNMHLKTQTPCFPAIFSFGSSVADTGTNLVLSIDSPGSLYPYGVTYPGFPTGRWSDGRLLIDFFAESLELPHLDSFIGSVASNFRHGVNFASAGASVCSQYSYAKGITLTLDFQIYHFQEFKRQALQMTNSRSGDGQTLTCGRSLPPASIFREALYVIAMGGNDIFGILKSGLSAEEKKMATLDVSQAIMQAVEELHKQGARNILVENIYPVACMPVMKRGNLDRHRCLKFAAELVSALNFDLLEKIQAFSQEHSREVSIAMMDTFSIRQDLMFHPEKHGLKEGYEPCYDGGSKLCTNPSEYVMWDSLHYTEAANAATMKAILTGNYFYPSFPLDRLTSCASAYAASR